MASWRRPPGHPRNVWLNKVQEDANALPLSMLWRTEIARVHGILTVRKEDFQIQWSEAHRISHIMFVHLSLHFNSHFPGEPELDGIRMSPFWILLARRMKRSGGDNWSYKMCKAAVIVTTNKPILSFYRPDALPVTQPTMLKLCKKNYHIPWTCSLQAHLGSSCLV